MTIHYTAGASVQDRITELEERVASLKEAYAQERAVTRELARKTDNRKKLGKSDVTRIRTIHASGNWTQREIAEAFDINPGTVSRIVRGVYHAAPVSV